jgi:hypothetical protein
MASMGFNIQTVVEMMAVIDEHRDSIKEADYVKFCNALKHLHGEVQESASTTPRYVSAVQQPIQELFYQLHKTEDEIRHLKRTYDLYAPTYVRLLNAHKQMVIVELLGKEVVTGPRGGTTILKKRDIVFYITYLRNIGLIENELDFNMRADQKKIEECNKIRLGIGSMITHLQQKLEQIKVDIERLC